MLRGGSFKVADAYCLHRGVLLPLGERGSVTHIVAAASARHVEVVPDLDLGAETFALYGQRYGDWRLDSLVDDMEVARFEADRLIMSGRYGTVRVVIESGPALGSPEAHRILFTAQGDQTGPAVMARETRRSSPPSGRAVVSLLVLAGVLFATIYAAAGNLY